MQSIYGQFVSRVFISHSRQDSELTRNVAVMLKNIGEEPVVMEYAPPDDQSVPPWSRIRDGVLSSDYIMLFKTENAIHTDYTKSWIAYEVGIAAANRKRLIVFERKGPPIKFPIPYLTDYMVFDPRQVSDFLEVQSIVKEIREDRARETARVKKKGILDRLKNALIPMPDVETVAGLILLAAPELAIQAFLLAMDKLLQGPVEVRCSHCKSAYRYFAGVLEPFRCPVCLSLVKPSSQYDEKFINSLRKFQEIVKAVRANPDILQ